MYNTWEWKKLGNAKLDNIVHLSPIIVYVLWYLKSFIVNFKYIYILNIFFLIVEINCSDRVSKIKLKKNIFIFYMFQINYISPIHRYNRGVLLKIKAFGIR